MFFKKIILVKFMIFCWFLLPNFPSFAMDPDEIVIGFDPDDRSSPQKTPKKKQVKWDSESDSDPACTIVDLSEASVETGSENEIKKLMNFPAVIPWSHPLKTIVRNAFEDYSICGQTSATVTYYPYNVIPEEIGITNPYTWTDTRLFLFALDRQMFIKPTSLGTKILKGMGGILGFGVPAALAPTVFVLAADLLDPIPVGGGVALGIFISSYIFTGPSFATQLYRFGGQIGNIIFDNNGLGPKEKDGDKRAHVLKKMYPIWSRLASIGTATVGTLPIVLLFMDAEEAFPLYWAFLVWPLSVSTFKKIYDYSMQFWGRWGNKEQDQPMTRHKKKALKDALGAMKEAINRPSSDELVGYLYDTMEKELERLQKEYGKKAQFYKDLRTHLENYKNNKNMSKRIEEIIEEYVKEKNITSEQTDDLISTISKVIIQNSKFRVDDLMGSIDESLQHGIRKIKITNSYNEKNDLFKHLNEKLKDYFDLNKQYLFYEDIFKFLESKNVPATKNDEIKRQIRIGVEKSYTSVLQETIQESFKKKFPKISLPKFTKDFTDDVKKNIRKEKGKSNQVHDIIVSYLKNRLGQMDERNTERNVEEWATELLNAAKSSFLEEKNMNPLLDDIYVYLFQDELGYVMLKNGLAIPQEDTFTSVFSMLLRKFETPLGFEQNLVDFKSALNKLYDAFQESKQKTSSQGHNLNIQQTETTELLELTTQLNEAGNIVAEAPTEALYRLTHILENKNPKPTSKKFLENLATYQQGAGQIGRFLITKWAVNKILTSYLGVNPDWTFGISLGVAGLDVLLRVIQEWHLQKDTFSSACELSSPCSVDYWPLRWANNAVSFISAGFLTLPAVAILKETLEDADPYIQALVILSTLPPEFTPNFAFLKENWNHVIRGGSEMLMRFFQTTAQKRAKLNDWLDEAIKLTGELDGESADLLHNTTQNTF